MHLIYFLSASLVLEDPQKRVPAPLPHMQLLCNILHGKEAVHVELSSCLLHTHAEGMQHHCSHISACMDGCMLTQARTDSYNEHMIS